MIDIYRVSLIKTETEIVKSKVRPCSPASIITDQLMFQKQLHYKVCKAEEVTTFNTLRKLKAREYDDDKSFLSLCTLTRVVPDIVVFKHLGRIRQRGCQISGIRWRDRQISIIRPDT